MDFRRVDALPPYAFAEDKGDVLDGGLPRHLIIGGRISTELSFGAYVCGSGIRKSKILCLPGLTPV